MNLIHHLYRQREFSKKAFGPSGRVKGVIDHIKKEIKEIEGVPDDLEEWIDLIILGFDGAWRAGYTPEQIVDMLARKQEINEGRDWPDWREIPEDKAIEHKRI